MDLTIPPPGARNDFEIAILCTLKIDFDAVEGLFDHFWEGDRNYGKAPGDPNAYSTGRIGEHDIVLAFLPGMGSVSSANVASSLRSSFTGIKLGLVVGVCGGSPYGLDREEILLGDIVISTAIVQSDFGQQYSDRIVITDLLEDSFGRPNTEIRAFLKKLSGLRASKQLRGGTQLYLSELLQKQDYKAYQYPGATNDMLYQASYRHKHHSSRCAICAKCQNDWDPVCDEAQSSACTQLRCEENMLVQRARLQSVHDTPDSGSLLAYQSQQTLQPLVHLGRIASANQTQQSAPLRDRLLKEKEVIAFEMEGAGAWDNFPTIVIKSVCDYADSHKNKIWQPYAAATAAACVKAFLKEWRRADRPQSLQQDPS
ncbi:MAG: hypothetical protein Q9180_005713 [Flavoplaca navasiana]